MCYLVVSNRSCAILGAFRSRGFNHEVVATRSPRLLYSATLGRPRATTATPNGVAAHTSNAITGRLCGGARNPVGVEVLVVSFPG